MAEDYTNRSPEQWIAYLQPRLNAQAAIAKHYRNYYNGVHRIAFATERFKEIFGRFFPASADNWMQVIVDSSVERLSIQGFRIGGADQPADTDAWNLWQQNKLEVGSRMGHTEAVKTGEAYILIDKTQEPTRITLESPLNAYVCTDDETGKRLAGIKRWIGEDEFGYMALYLEDRFYRYRSRSKVKAFSGEQHPQWEEYQTAGGAPHGLDVVPLIPLENNPDLVLGGTSDLMSVIPIQDRVNKLCLDLDVDSEFHAAPQRWATGWDPPVDATGQPLPATKVEAATSRFLAFSDPETKVGQLPGGDPSGFVDPIEMYIQHMAAISHTPPHYLLGRMVNISGDALTAAETGLVSKCQAKITDFSGPWREAMALATENDPEDVYVVWKDPESRTFGQLVDGVVKLRRELALPLEMSWEIIGLTPQQIDRAKKLIGLPERDFEALDRGMAERQRQESVQKQIVQGMAAAAQNGNNQGPGAKPEPVSNGSRRDA